MPVIGVSGAQGSGKSTILNALQVKGYSVDPYKVSRAVQERRQWTGLKTVEQTWEQMVDFQREILEVKIAHDKVLAETGKTIFVERTLADVVAYSALWAWKFVDRNEVTFDTASKFITEMLAAGLKAQPEIYSGVVVVPLMRHVQWENDPQRASQSDADYVFSEVEEFCRFGHLRNQAPAFHIIQSATVEDRVAEVETFVKELT